MRLLTPRCFVVLAFLLLSSAHLARAAARNAGEAEQLRIIAVMSEQLRQRIDALPVLLPRDHPLGEVVEQALTLNREPVVVEGQRFDGVVITAPTKPASFAWALATPSNLASWYILREEGEMTGFRDFLRRPKSRFPQAQRLLPEAAAEVTFQRLDSRAFSPGERYVLWFRFKDDAPAEFSVRAGFFAAASLNNNRLPELLLTDAAQSKAQR